MHTKIEKPRKTFWEEWIAREVMIGIKILKKNVRIIEKKGIRSQGPFLFFNKKMEHPHVKKGNKHQFHWGGLDLQNKRNFSAFFGQTEASVKRPRSASHAREEWKKKHEKTPVPRRTGAIFCVFPTNRGKQEASTKSESRMEGAVQKRKAKPAVPCTYTNCSSYFPQTLAETTTNMVLCRGNIFSKEMTVTSKHMLLCERHLKEGDIFERK